jgi:hypothetical protein
VFERLFTGEHLQNEIRCTHFPSPISGLQVNAYSHAETVSGGY